MKVLQVGGQGENTLVKEFLDELEKLGVECILEVTHKGNEVTFKVKARETKREQKRFKKAVSRCLMGKK